MPVRGADPQCDAAACAAIYAPYVETTPVSFEEASPSAAQLAERIEASHAWLIAEADGETTGFAYATEHRWRPAYRWAADVSIYVAGDRRGAGVGRALYAALIERLRERGFHTACAGITLPNEASVALHERFGFEPVGVYREIGWKLEEWHDVGWWQLRLGPADPPTTIGGHD